MANNLLISVFCPDRVGLISALTARLFDLGGDLGDTTFAVLGEGAEFTSICEFPADLTSEYVRAELADLPQLAGATIEVRPFELDPGPQPQARVTHHVECEGVNRPGLVARMTEIFQEYGANIVRLAADRQDRKGEDYYLTRIAAFIPEERADSCLATLANTAGELRQIIRWHRTEDGI
ncbi:glycine cleavage system protein R [Magnetospira sp. QH-2]|uniref:glycine cleavage system protein R n=1 Tax=Magnetospira sp. (strain QH-2) TaxID=1288970 RepID=UPI0003E80A84|nr:ACT domain-containing protein [Magnetospira sp. QH-2]CCQ72650.1 Putative amino acid-binding ACT domain protein [Magnetospira sp. QH-2]